MIEFILPHKKDKPPVKFITIKELGALCKTKKSEYALKKLIYRGLIPDANFRAPSRVHKRGDNQGAKFSGARLYSLDYLVPKLLPLLNRISQGKSITPEVRNEIYNVFAWEKNFFETEY